LQFAALANKARRFENFRRNSESAPTARLSCDNQVVSALRGGDTSPLSLSRQPPERIGHIENPVCRKPSAPKDRIGYWPAPVPMRPPRLTLRPSFEQAISKRSIICVTIGVERKRPPKVSFAGLFYGVRLGRSPVMRAAHLGGERSTPHLFRLWLRHSDALFREAGPAETTAARLDGDASRLAPPAPTTPRKPRPLLSFSLRSGTAAQSSPALCARGFCGGTQSRGFARWLERRRGVVAPRAFRV
jgi:hypothetical protein